MTFIYALCEPGTRTVRYIGKTNNPKKRLRQHLGESIKKKTHLGNWLRSLLRVPPNLVILSEVPEAEGNAEEIRYIAAARTSLGMSLVNSTDGGEGCINPTPETRAKISLARKGKQNSPEHRAAISAANTGVPLSPEHRAAIGTSMKGFVKSPAHCAALSAALTGVPQSPERCAAKSAAMTGVKKGPYSPEHCAAMSAAWTPERRAAQSAATRAAKTGMTHSIETRAAISATKKGVPWSAARIAAQERRKATQQKNAEGEV